MFAKLFFIGKTCRSSRTLMLSTTPMQRIEPNVLESSRPVADITRANQSDREFVTRRQTDRHFSVNICIENDELLITKSHALQTDRQERESVAGPFTGA